MITQFFMLILNVVINIIVCNVSDHIIELPLNPQLLGGFDWMIFHLFLRIMIFRCSIKCPEWVNWFLFHLLRFIYFSLQMKMPKISGCRALVLAMQNRFIMYQIIVPYIFLPLSHLEKNLHLFFKSQVGSHVCYMYPIIYVSCFVWLCMWPWMLWLCYWSPWMEFHFGAKCDNI